MTTFRGSFYIPDLQTSSQIQKSLTPKSGVLMRKFTHKSSELVLERWGEVEWLLIPSMLTAVCGWLGVSLCLPTTWWVFLGHIRQQHRIPTTLSLMASTKMNRAVSRKCYYQGFFFFFNVKTGLPSTCMTGSQSIYTLSYCWTGEETTHPAKGHHIMWIVKARDQPCSVSKSVL